VRPVVAFVLALVLSAVQAGLLHFVGGGAAPLTLALPIVVYLGLRAGEVDGAVGAAAVDETALTVRELRTDPVPAILRGDDPLAGRDRLRLADLADRRWFQFPRGTEPMWQAYWNGGEPREGPMVRVVQECLQAVLWNGTVGLAPLGHELPAWLPVQLVAVPLTDMPPSRVVVAWNEGDDNPLIRSFVDIATTAYRR
jgi:hypothetical protein